MPLSLAKLNTSALVRC